MAKTALKIIGRYVPEAPTVIALSGIMVDPCIYDQVEVPSGFQLIAVDYFDSLGPWNVRSVARNVLDFIHETKIGPTVLVGYSAGGVIAMTAACMEPDLIAGLMLSNTGPCTLSPMPPESKDVHLWKEKSFIDDFLTRRFSRPVPPLLYQRLVDYALKVKEGAPYELSSSLRDTDLREELYKVTCPIVVAHGKFDPYRPVEYADMIREAAPQTEVFLLDGGHTIMIEEKEAWQRCLDHLLDEIRGRYLLKGGTEP